MFAVGVVCSGLWCVVDVVCGVLCMCRVVCVCVCVLVCVLCVGCVVLLRSGMRASSKKENKKCSVSYLE